MPNQFKKGDRIRFKDMFKGWYGIVTSVRRATEYGVEETKVLVFDETDRLVAPTPVTASAAIIEKIEARPCAT